MFALHIQDGKVVKVEAHDGRTPAPRPGRTVEVVKEDDPRIAEWQKGQGAEQARAAEARKARDADDAQLQADVKLLLKQNDAASRVLLRFLRGERPRLR